MLHNKKRKYCATRVLATFLQHKERKTTFQKAKEAPFRGVLLLSDCCLGKGYTFGIFSIPF